MATYIVETILLEVASFGHNVINDLVLGQACGELFVALEAEGHVRNKAGFGLERKGGFPACW
jgi:hypothetical protein